MHYFQEMHYFKKCAIFKNCTSHNVIIVFTTEALAGDDKNGSPIVMGIEEGTTVGKVFEDDIRAGSNGDYS